MDGSRGSASATKACPECGATIHVDTRAVTWCLDCEWNLHPGGSLSPRAARAARRNEALAGRLLRRGAKGRSGLGARLALVLSLLAVTLTGVSLVGGLAVAIVGRDSPLLVGLGVILSR